MLNLVPLEFYGELKVQDAFKSYMEHLARAYPSDKVEGEHFAIERRDRLYTLLQEMAATLGFDFDRSELMKLTYAPIGWTNDEQEQRGLRTHLLALLQGRSALPVMEVKPSDLNKKFPPPP
jgi:hypothetical protein